MAARAGALLVAATGPALIPAAGAALDKEVHCFFFLGPDPAGYIWVQLVVRPDVLRGHEGDDAAHDRGQDGRAGSTRAGLHPPEP